MDNNDIVTWSIVIAVIAFVVLCVYLINLLRTAQHSLVAAQGAIREVKETVENLQGEVKTLAENVNNVANDLKGKLKSIDPLFDAVEDVGVLLTEVTGTARMATHHLSQTFRKQAASADTTGTNKLSPSWLQWAALGSRILMGARKGWKEHEKSKSQDNHYG